MIKEFTDIVIIGPGLAGVYTALNIDKKYDVTVISKSTFSNSNSVLAQGGIACELTDDEERLKAHINDTLKAGSFLNDVEAVNVLIREANKNIKNVQNLGVNFDNNDKGELLKTKEGGHSTNRILHAGGDQSGYFTTMPLISVLKERKNIQLLEHTMATDLVIKDNKVIGVIVLPKGKKAYPLFARAVVIATGGIGQVYGASTNDITATADGIGLAVRANLEIQDMEFVQFHPTALFLENDHESHRFLITEALRGEGAYLLNTLNERFMVKYSPQLELAPRDIVSQSIYREMYDTWSDHVFLDTRHLDKTYLAKRFPKINEKLLENNIKLGEDLIPVAPVEHFLCGGIKTNLNGETKIANLYAVGECARTGVHGANRLASNSLLECLVFGARVSENINNTLDNILLDETKVSINQNDYDYNYRPIRKKIERIMDEYVGIVRISKNLIKAVEELEDIKKSLLKYPNATKYYYETLNMVLCALEITKAAINRKENIGCHLVL